jgi:hypothetical protein
VIAAPWSSPRADVRGVESLNCHATVGIMGPSYPEGLV